MQTNYFYRSALANRIKSIFENRLLWLLNVCSCDYYLKGSDGISLPLLRGQLHDPEVIHIIKRLASQKSGSNVLFDIGANIGLVSIPLIDQFDHIYALEPNPITYGILQANLMLAKHSCGDPDKAIVPINYGVSDTCEEALLTIPIWNQGGAYVNNKKNQYMKETLERKEMCNESMEQKIELLTLRRVLDSLESPLSTLSDNSKENTMIFKVDVEGFETVILGQIYANLPLLRKYVGNIHIVMEALEGCSQYVSHTPDNYKHLIHQIKRYYTLPIASAKWENMPKFLIGFLALIGGEHAYCLERIDCSKDDPSTIVISISLDE